LLAGEGKNDILDIGFRRKHEVELQLPAVAVKHNIDARIDVLEFQPLKIPDTCPPLPRIARVVVRMDIHFIHWLDRRFRRAGKSHSDRMRRPSYR
jgi:hypothetical protein